MSRLTSNTAQRNHPVIGVLFGFHMYGVGQIYDYVDSLTRGILAGARDFDCSLLLGCGVSLLSLDKLRPAWPVPLPDTDFVPVGPWNTDGLIVVHPLSSPARSQFIRELKTTGFPMVFVGSDEGGPAINVDNEGGIHQAVSHLVRHGHRRIAFIAGHPDDENGDGGQRLRAFHRCIAAFGLEDDARLIAYGCHHIVSGREAMQTILSSGVHFSAVVTSNDESALGAMQVLAESGLRVPEDVAVIGFDNRPDTAFGLSSLTTVHHPVFERGYRAVELLVGSLKGGHAHDKRIVQTSTHLVIRRSCGCTWQDVVSSDDLTAPSRLVATQKNLLRTAINAVMEKFPQAELEKAFELSTHLIHGFIASLDSGSEIDFISTLRSVLTRAGEAVGDAEVWEFVINAMEKSLLTDVSSDSINNDAGRRDHAERLFRTAETVIHEGKYGQNYHNRHVISELKGLLTARLFAARDEVGILKMLSEDAPKIGIRRCAVVLFEPDGDDAIAWSVMRTSTNPDGAPTRFRSRDFPPPEFDFPRKSVRLAVVPFAPENNVSGCMVFDTDDLSLCAEITRAVNAALVTCQIYRRATETSRLYQDALEHRRVAEEASSSKSRFFSVVGHELRTPLNLIVAASESLERERTESGGAHASNIAHIRAGAQQVEGLVRDVLDLTMDEIGQLRLSCEAADLVTTLEPVATLGEQLARAKGLSWRSEIPKNLPLMWADRARIRQVALNLVSNAVKFTDRGQIVLRASCEDDKLVVSVRDSGAGVPPVERNSIFNEFYQSSRTVGRGGGLGLGLAISKKLIELHLGEIDVLPDDGGDTGSTFFFTLPVLKTSVDQIADTLTRTQTVLIVDQPSKESRELQLQLARRGFLVRCVADEDPSALLIALISEPSTAVLLKVTGRVLADKNFMSLLRDSLDAQKKNKVVFYSLPENAAAAPSTLEYLTKPIGSQDLLQVMKRHGVDKDASSRTILVVEDDLRLLEMHASLVQTLSASHRVLKAQNGLSAIAIIKKERPDLVLLDLVMPKMDGFQVLDAMHENEATRNVPVVVMSGQALSDNDIARLQRGVTTLLIKGVFNVDETLDHVQRALDQGTVIIGEPQRLVRKAMVYIHQHYGKSLTRKDVARHLGISEDYITRCFRQVLRMSFVTYLTRYRIDRAKVLLDSGAMNLASVASAVGFCNEFHFSQVFRRYAGITPSRYRRKKSS